jgi:acyl phosphate:glycerol-3-phosphate acyltransferase
MEIVLYIIFSYFIGSIMAGFFVVKLLGNKDIRLEGSGNVGARNAGRVHGKTSFILTFLGDALKGAIVIIAGTYFSFQPEIILAGLGAAIIGHVKPITLNFKGGMGISTFIGGILAFEPLLSIVLIAGFLILFPFTKSFTFAGLGAFTLLPFAIYIRTGTLGSSILTGILVLIILYVHREDIKERLEKRRK